MTSRSRSNEGPSKREDEADEKRNALKMKAEKEEDDDGEEVEEEEEEGEYGREAEGGSSFSRGSRGQ